MRATTLLALTLLACGTDPEVELLELRQSSFALENGAAADAILGQETERGLTPTRTDAGGFGTVAGVAIGLANNQLWVADTANQRVLGFADATTVSDGARAGMVLNQDDFATTDYRHVPADQQIVPTGVAVDPEGRVYVYDTTNVLVYENPFADDAVVDYELTGEPVNIRSVRALDHNKLAVVGADALVFYERGSPDPYGQGGFAAPCAGSAWDLVEPTASNLYFVACSANLVCSDGLTFTCSGVAVYDVDTTTNLVDQPPTPYVAYTDLAGAQSIQVDGDRLFVADTTGHRILRFDGAATHARSVIGGGAAQTPTNALASYGQPDNASIIANYHSTTPGVVSGQGLYQPAVIAITPSNHSMWVADQSNWRVLAFNDVTGSNPSETPARVLGQTDVNHAFPNRLEGNSFAQIAGVAIGPGPGSRPRAAVVDSASNRVLLYDDIAAYETNGNPTHAIGQVSLIDYKADSATPTASGLNGPTHVAIGNLGWVWVTDAGSARVLAFENPATNAPASRVFGATNPTTAGVYGSLGPIAVSADNVFVGAGNRVFMYAITGPAVKPNRVFGQEQPPAGVPAFDDIGNAANRGGGPRPDSLAGVTGVAVDSSGRLWVADSGNNRVLWFDSPASSTAPLTETVTADGVVGQPDFSSNTARMGTGTVNRYSFAGIADIAVTDDGTLWVADLTDSRLLAFFNPMEPDPVLGVPRADLVLGQEAFTDSGSNLAPNGINARTLSGPYSVAADATGRVLLVSDRGNNRAVRYIRNRPPVVTGDGSFDVVRGESLIVTVTITDPESDLIQVDAVNPYVAAVTGAPPLSVPVTFQAPLNAPVGSDTVVTIVATDLGDRPQQTTFSMVFHVIDRPFEPASGAPPEARPPINPKTGCVCSGGAGAVPWLMVLVALRRRRRV